MILSEGGAHPPGSGQTGFGGGVLFYALKKKNTHVTHHSNLSTFRCSNLKYSNAIVTKLCQVLYLWLVKLVE